MQSYPGKRAVDLIAAGMACLIFAPLAVAIALLTWLEDGGSPLFLQTRVGYRRRPFTVLKFRTMRDQQVTRVGRWLRQTGLDELPQFINVCRGEMSVIGPRPLTSEDVRRLGWATQNHEWRFATRPGITGLSQLLAGRSARYSRRLERLYLRRQGFSFDLRLIALSFAVSLAGKRIVRQWLRRTTDGSTRQGRVSGNVTTPAVVLVRLKDLHTAGRSNGSPRFRNWRWCFIPRHRYRRANASPGALVRSDRDVDERSTNRAGFGRSQCGDPDGGLPGPYSTL